MAVYQFRVKVNGSAGGVKYTDGMIVEVADRNVSTTLVHLRLLCC